ncbi:aspartate--tRNA(Asn) ligase [Amycolatopsis rubida]|uniref:Aspartate--tRNA(Asp/Asn) ligase n=1 Tax=Amycolatopsis rubida TaxID=112413 RepID=A0A1I5YYK1_9PSEU|nr:aspartate--tRNA(Asn) ligase [Amycolatopsis rubida]SFQ49200.1 nondiscriminating aspartyl-tRNA synthetase [Amycolatopsis rubida]
MSTRTPVACLRDRVGSTVTIAGWVHRRRVLKSVAFLVVRDRSGTAQAVFAEPPEVAEETVVRLTGQVVANPQAPQGAELREPAIEVLSAPEKRPPFALYRPEAAAGLPVVLDNAAVALRHPVLRRRFEVAAASVAAFRRVLDRQGFTEIHTPKIVATATESGANVFQLDYFGRPAYLAQSPQFFKQAMVGVFERVYEAGPVFRAEPHDTARHLAQYTSLDAELGFIADHRDVMAVLRDVVAEMAAAARPDAPAVPAEIPSIDFAVAQELLARNTGEDPRGEPDLAPAHERWLCEWAAREHGSEFLFVTGYPMAKRPFYTHPDPANPVRSNSFDLLFRGLELVTGGQRLHRHADYLAVLGEAAGQYSDYLDAFAYGMPPHGGFAIGLERWVARVLGVANVRGATLFPRDLHRLRP